MKPLLTKQQKSLRRAARWQGQNAVDALNLALHPVYDGDEEIFTRLAIDRARQAWRYAIQAANTAIAKAEGR